MNQAERVARAMCEADGRNPDELVYIVSQASTQGGKGPRWKTYLAEARRFIAAQKALAVG